MQITTAREIIKRAKADETYEGPVPEDDATCIKEAQGLVEMAEQAYAQHIRGPEVEAILKIAAAEENGDQPTETEEPEASAEDEADHAPPVSDEDAPEGVPSALVADNEGLAKKEPWDGYTDSNVKDVTGGISWFLDDIKDEGDLLELLRNVYAFEVAHKNRSRVLDHVIEAWGKAGGATDVETEEPESEPEEPEADAGDESEGEIDAESSEGPSDEAEPDEKSKPDASQGAYRKLVEVVERELANERLDGIPKPPDEEAPKLPWNWNEVNDADLHNMHMQFASYAYFKGYQRARDERIAMHCKEAADELSNKLLLAAPKPKDFKVTVLEAEIASDPNVKRWRKLQRKHEAMAQAAKNEQESYHRLVEALSRLETMRHNAWERAK